LDHHLLLYPLFLHLQLAFFSEVEEMKSKAADLANT
jgi:hypothetical protein